MTTEENKPAHPVSDDEVLYLLRLIKATSSVKVTSKHDQMMAMHKLASCQEYVSKALDLLSTPDTRQAVREWMPIESAPRDGKTLMVWWQGGCWWGKRTEEKYNNGEYVWDVKFGNAWMKANPSHWMPLPAPPVIPAKEAPKPSAPSDALVTLKKGYIAARDRMLQYKKAYGTDTATEIAMWAIRDADEALSRLSHPAEGRR